MPHGNGKQRVLVVGAGPVGALAALYAARRGDNVAVYDLRDGNIQGSFHESHVWKPCLLSPVIISFLDT